MTERTGSLRRSTPRSVLGPSLTLGRIGLRRGLRNRSLLLMGVVGPLALGAILALAFGGSGPSIVVGLADLDGSPLSEGVSEGISDALEGSGVDLRLIEPSGGDPEAAVRRLVEDGDVGAALVLPSGYGASVAATPEALEVVAAGDNPYAESVAESVARSIASQTDLRRAVVAGLAGAGVDPGPAATGPLEPAISVDIADFAGQFDAQLYFGPLAVFLFLGLGISARSLLRDQGDGLLDRIRAAPVSTRQVVGGSAVTVWVQGALSAATVVLLSTIVFGAVWGDPAEVSLVLGIFVISVAGLLGLVVGVSRTEAQAESWTNLLAFTFAIVGGSFFGGQTLPGAAGVIGILTPNGAAMRALIELGPGGRSVADVWYLLAWMLLIGVSGTLWGAHLMRRRLR